MNEAAALLRRTFEALYSHDADYEYSADVILWLEARGLGGIGTLAGALQDMRIAVTPRLTLDKPKRCCIDAGGASLLALAASAIDIALAQSAVEHDCHVSIVNGRQPLAIVPAVAGCALSNVAAAAAWYDKSANRLHRVRAPAASAQPDYTILVPEGSPPWAHNDIELFVATNDALMLELAGRHPMFSEPGRHVTEITADEFRQRYELSVNHGIAVSDANYQALSAVANRVLVEATEESRRGAGE